ncbi:MAG: sigma-70 family RNA polymerase sigma factor [Rhodanobacteraceae bacterium]|nr:sigma-70 family RNA polymerase sigma factor [Rhodanobacteraceae bacterium]
MSGITGLLAQSQQGDASAWGAIIERLYGDMRRLAHNARKLNINEAPDTTALVHECYLRMHQHGASGIQSRAHFFNVAASAMRQLLINHARDRVARKRGGGNVEYATLSECDNAADQQATDLLELDDIMRSALAGDERLIRVVELKVFAGLTDTEIAEAFDMSVRTAQRLWQEARDKLRAALTDQADTDQEPARLRQ